MTAPPSSQTAVSFFGGLSAALVAFSLYQKVFKRDEFRPHKPTKKEIKEMLWKTLGINANSFVCLVGESFDFYTFEIGIKNKDKDKDNNLYVMRIPKNTEALTKLKSEIDVLQECEQKHTFSNFKLKIPCVIKKWTNVARDATMKDSCFAMYHKIAGTPVQTISNIAERHSILNDSVENIACFCRTLHECRHDMSHVDQVSASAKFMQIIHELECIITTSKRIVGLDSIFDKEEVELIEHVIVHECKQILLPLWRRMEKLSIEDESCFTHRLIHGELHTQNLIIHEHKVGGIIEWSDICFTDVAFEFRWICAENEEVGKRLLDWYCRKKGEESSSLRYHGFDHWFEHRLDVYTTLTAIMLARISVCLQETEEVQNYYLKNARKKIKMWGKKIKILEKIEVNK